MKILCENFLSVDNTQSMYLPRALSSYGATVGIRKAGVSLYETLDDFSPDYFLLHAQQITEDLVTYLNDADAKNIRLIINCFGMNTQTVVHFEEELARLNIKSHVEFLFSSRNHDSLPRSASRMVCLPECGDDLLSQSVTTTFPHQIQTLVVGEIETAGILGSWHNVAINAEPVEGYDFTLPLNMLTPILKNYEFVRVHTKYTNIPQIVFDALLSGCNVSLSGNNPYTQEKLDAICSRVFGQRLREGNDQSSLPELIKQKHLPINRAKTLLSQISTNQKDMNL